MTQNPIGIFDSGIGGMTVAKAIASSLPNEQLIYFGDTAHFPYGDKSEAAIQAYSIKICNVLLSQNCKAIVIACNSASASAYELVKEYVGSKAIVINVIDPVVEYVTNTFKASKVGIIGTKRTIQSNVYKTRIDAQSRQIETVSLATPLLAPMVEEGFFNNKISTTIIENYLQEPSLQDMQALVLGCTHYPLIKNEISAYYQGLVEVIDSSVIVSNHLHQVLVEASLVADQRDKSHTFYVSDYTNAYKQSTAIFFGEEVNLERYKLW